MKKRALILAMIAFIAATTSEPSINMVRAEETQVEEKQTEENAGQTSELPIKTLTPKVMDVNPYMAASDSNIHHDCYNTDSTDEVLPVDIYSEINVSYEKVNPNASPEIPFIRIATVVFGCTFSIVIVFSHPSTSPWPPSAANFSWLNTLRIA